MELNQPNMIEKYLRNELSGNELAAFESNMSKDPVFKSEVLFQKQVIDGIREYRKTELKARLDAIDVSPSWWSSGSLNPTVLRIAGGVITAAIIGTGVFYFTGSEDTVITETIEEQPIKIETPQPVEPEIAPEVIAPLEEEIVEETPHAEKGKQIVAVTPETTLESVEEKGKTETLEESVNEEEREEVAFNPSVSLPDPGEVEDQESFNPEEVTIPSAASGDVVAKTDPIDIRVEDKKSDQIRYKYYDGILHLYGDFKDQKYEILEINSHDSRKVYLYYAGKYYYLLATDKATELNEVTDAAQLAELKIVRNNKAD